VGTEALDVSQFVDAEHGLIRGEIFHSQQIYEAELEHIFARSWLFLAHDKMIPKAGDFIENYMGEDGERWTTQRYEWVAPGISAEASTVVGAGSERMSK
jgi:hypothetical protein